MTWTFTRSPADQIATSASSNDNYSWTGAYNVNRHYSTDGLNRYSQAGTARFTYDANGNLLDWICLKDCMRNIPLIEK